MSNTSEFSVTVLEPEVTVVWSDDAPDEVKE